MVVIERGSVRLVIDGGEWSGDDEVWVRIARAVGRWAGYPPTMDYVPDSDARAATHVAQAIGGEVVHYEPPVPFDPDVVY